MIASFLESSGIQVCGCVLRRVITTSSPNLPAGRRQGKGVDDQPEQTEARRGKAPLSVYSCQIANVFLPLPPPPCVTLTCFVLFFLTTLPFSCLLCKMLVLIMPTSWGYEGEVDCCCCWSPVFFAFTFIWGILEGRILEGRPQGRNEFQL